MAQLLPLVRVIYILNYHENCRMEVSNYMHNIEYKTGPNLASVINTKI